MSVSTTTTNAAAAFDQCGYWIEPGVLTAVQCDALAARIQRSSAAGAGTRHMLKLRWIEALARTVRRHRVLKEITPPDCAAVQCTLFAKSRVTNWAVSPHRDLSIPVAARVPHRACAGWAEKEGMLFVQPPPDVLAQLVAVRVHVDECTEDSGALKLQPGSHRHLFASGEPRASRAAAQSVAGAVSRGDAMALRPLLVHASSKTIASAPRRVLHFLFGPRTLPFGLQWAPMTR